MFWVGSFFFFFLKLKKKKRKTENDIENNLTTSLDILFLP